MYYRQIQLYKLNIYFKLKMTELIINVYCKIVVLDIDVKGAVSATPLFLFTSGNDKLNCLK